MFKQVKYLYILFETLREYFSVNIYGDLSILYRYCASCLWYLQPKWDFYDTFRNDAKIIAQCKWTKGQLTNTLNYLFDPISKRITVTPASFVELFAPDFNYQSNTFAYEFGDAETPIYASEFQDTVNITETLINVPSDLDSDAIKNVCNQIVISGLTFKMNVI